MKRFSFAVLAIFAAFTLTACAPMQADSPAQTPAKIAAQFCPSALIAITSLEELEGISTADTLALVNVSNIVTPVCTAVADGGVVAATDLKTFASAYSPVFVSIVKASSMDPDKKNRILLDLAVAQIAIAALPDVTATGQ
jgi:hypothetical protein